MEDQAIRQPGRLADLAKDGLEAVRDVRVAATVDDDRLACPGSRGQLCGQGRRDEQEDRWSRRSAPSSSGSLDVLRGDLLPPQGQDVQETEPRIGPDQGRPPHALPGNPVDGLDLLGRPARPTLALVTVPPHPQQQGYPALGSPRRTLYASAHGGGGSGPPGSPQLAGVPEVVDVLDDLG